MREGLQPDATAEQLQNQMEWYRSELAGARSTIRHMTRSMSWLSGHDRQGLDHLDEAMSEARARERAVEQARRWATRARATEAALTQLADQLEAKEAHGGAWDSNQEAARRIRAVLEQQKGPTT
ncbi:hypothetical protein OG352_05500 [Streptomyces sp. NBC_01485]|uniref:hypothetical protein n=1 Tax=Streptomyces sp. NBC_01485 TaxID=2903884 RepID=UPI002E3188A5|nr:hypothetical protein [Streptomyces sp. NBC_01485]